jgi:signal transduction histidine kinase
VTTVVDVEDARLLRAVGLFRVAALGYSAVVLARAQDDYRHPLAAWAVLGGLAVWTAAVVIRPPRRLPGLVIDLAVAVAAVLATALVDDPARIAAGAQTLPTFWPASVVIAWAVWGGRWAGLVAAAVVSVADVVEVGGRLSASTLNNIVLLLLTGLVVGYAMRLFRAGQADLAQAVGVRAAAAERERLARDIHDSVLQVLGYVTRRASEIGGDAAELGRLAGEQEIRLRALVGSGPAPATGGAADLRSGLSALARSGVTISTTATPVVMDVDRARHVTAAVAAALANVAEHAGPDAAAWVLLEDTGDAVVVTVRDDGRGIPDGRLAVAEREGRLGVAASIRGRIADLGGRVEITSAPDGGTEVEMWVPRQRH